MGLDIVAYSKLEHERDERVAAVMESLFSPLGEEVIHIFEESERLRCMDMKIGKWHRTDETQEIHFRAGSYSGYNTFRNLLAKAFHGVSADDIWSNEDNYEGSPFYEMINFSDCDGVIGPYDSDKLHQDFVNGEEEFQEYLMETFGDDDEVEYYLGVYRNFTHAFKLSSQNGILIFC